MIAAKSSHIRSKEQDQTSRGAMPRNENIRLRDYVESLESNISLVQEEREVEHNVTGAVILTVKVYCGPGNV